MEIQIEKMIQQTQDALQAVCASAPQDDLRYFCQLWIRFLKEAPGRHGPQIAALDVAVPDIYLRACGFLPVYVFGGSYYSDERTEQLFPQISDPVLKSAAGLLVSRNLPVLKGIGTAALHVRNTEGRKVQAFLKENGFHVIPWEPELFPKDRMPDSYRDAQMHILLQIKAASDTALTESRLYQEADISTRAHRVLLHLQGSDYPEMVKAMVCQSYYLAADREAWIQETARLAAKRSKTSRRGICLMGSPIRFPNEKMLSALQEVGILHMENRCGVRLPVDYAGLLRRDRYRLPELMENLHQIHYRDEIHHPSALQANFPEGVPGVVYHLLKGHLNEAYHAERMEKAAIQRRVPFLCVETDYSDADREQVKVRLEGFAELLRWRDKQ